MTENYGPGADYYNQVVQRDSGDSAIRHYLNVVRRRVWVFGTVFLVVVTVGTVNAFRRPRIFRAVAKVLVEKTTPNIIKMDGVVPEGGWYDPDYYNTQVELVRSRAILEKAIADSKVRRIFRLDAGSPDPATTGNKKSRTWSALLGSEPVAPLEPWELLRGWVSADAIPSTQFILIKAQGQNPEHAADIANAVATAFEQYHLARKLEAHGDAFDVLRQDKDKVEKELLAAERALQNFREKAEGVSLDATEQDQPVLKRLSELNDEMTATQLARIDLKAQLKVIRELLKEGVDVSSDAIEKIFNVPVLRDDSVVSGVRKELMEAVRKVQELSEFYGPEHPLLKSARANVAHLREKFSQTLEETIVALENKLRTLNAKEEEVTRQYEEQKQQALALAQEVFEFGRLKNDVSRFQRLFEVLVERMREVDMSAGYLKTNVQVVESAGVPKVPVGSSRTRFILLSLLFGVFAGFGLALVVEHFDDAIWTPEDLRLRMGLPLLGFVPRVVVDAERRLGPADPDDRRYHGMISVLEPMSSAAEGYRGIRTSLFFTLREPGAKALAMISCTPGEGKTTTASNLALSIAQSGKRVILLDADMHRPVVHKVFGLDSNPGLSQVLLGEITLDEAIQRPSVNDEKTEFFHVLTAGPEIESPSEMLGSERMRQVMNDLRKKYDWIIVDTPPILFVSDGSIVSGITDGAILVVKAGANSQSVLLRARDHLNGLKIKTLGCVLNHMMVSRYGRYYSEYYHHGYSRYSRDYHRAYYTPSSGPGVKNVSPASSDSSSKKPRRRWSWASHASQVPAATPITSDDRSSADAEKAEYDQMNRKLESLAQKSADLKHWIFNLRKNIATPHSDPADKDRSG